MRKNIIPALLLALLAAASCTKDPEQHRLSITYPDGLPLYADQTEDSVVFGTFDSWKVHSLEPWMTVKGESSKNLTYDYYRYYIFSVELDFKPNATGHTRYGSIEVDSYEYQAYAFYTQYGFLNIYHPMPNILSMVSGYRAMPDTVEFVLRDSADVLTDSICFKVRNDWTLTQTASGEDAEWITASATSGKAGDQNVRLSMQPNTSGNSRIADFVLQSGEVKNTIRVVQTTNKMETPKEEEE